MIKLHLLDITVLYYIDALTHTLIFSEVLADIYINFELYILMYISHIKA